jgi:hypothetical protein
MALIGTFSAADLARVQNYVDQTLRPTVLGLAKALARANIAVIPQYLASPTGLPSTIAAPAVDSIAGLLATLDVGQVIPILSSGLPLSGPLLASKVAGYSGSLNTMLATYFSANIQQDYAQIVGSINLLNVS